MSKLLKKGSKAAKAWGEKMRRLRGRVRKTTTRRRRTTRKGMLTLRRKKAYSPKSKSNKPRTKTDSGLKLPKFGGTAKKIAIGLGAAQLVGFGLNYFAPQLIPIGKPIAALVAGGLPGVAAELVLDQGLLQNITGLIGGIGGGINEQRLVSGL